MIAGSRSDPKPAECHNSLSRAQRAANPTLVRWGKFNLVGAIGIGVQFATLFSLKTELHFQYLVATAIAVETAVLHNFVWHKRFTWVDRISADRLQCTTSQKQNARSTETNLGRNLLGLSPGFFRRLWRFHFANGAVSILGNLAMMKILVGSAHMNYLPANAIAVAVCSLANFLLSDQWVFEN
jgi:putative flippase GtrA